MPQLLTQEPPGRANDGADVSRYVLRERRVDDLVAAEVAAWQQLSGRCAEPNPFQSPEFVLPALRYLEDDAEGVRLLALEDRVTGAWRAAGVFRALSPSVSRPLSRLRSFSTVHSYLDVPLIDAEESTEVARAWLAHLSAGADWNGLRIPQLVMDGTLASQWRESSSDPGYYVFDESRWSRAAIDLSRVRAEELLTGCSKSRRKSLRRGRRWLEQQGAVVFRLRRIEPGETEPVETFLQLEHLGWKGQEGTSLLSERRHAMFFRAMCEALAARGGVVFGELLVDDRVIASTCNLVSGHVLFAFKIGWDPQYAEASPGLLSELFLAESIAEEMPQVTLLDSCSSQGSHLEGLWPHQIAMGSVICVWSRAASLLTSLREHARYWKRAVLNAARSVSAEC